MVLLDTGEKEKNGRSSCVAQNENVSLVGQLDLVKNFNVGEKVNLHLDSQKLYAFGLDESLASSPFKELARG